MYGKLQVAPSEVILSDINPRMLEVGEVGCCCRCWSAISRETTRSVLLRWATLLRARTHG